MLSALILFESDSSSVMLSAFFSVLNVTGVQLCCIHSIYFLYIIASTI